MAESELLALFVGVFQEVGFQRAVFGEESHDGRFLGGQVFLELSQRLKLSGSRSSLSFHVLHDSGGFAGSIVVGRDLSVLEDLERWVSRHLELVASFLSGLGTVDLDEADWWLLAAQQF